MTNDIQRQLNRHAAGFKKYPGVLAREMHTVLDRSGNDWLATMTKRVSGKVALGRRSSSRKLGVRSGKLRNSLKQKMSPKGSLKVSMELASRGTSYAAAQEFGAVITPKNAKWLWIPLKDNLTPTGRTRKTPRMLMSQPKHTLRFVPNKRGTLTVLYEPRSSQSGFNTPRKSRNFDKAKAMFFLTKKSVIPGPKTTGTKSRFGFFDTWNNKGAARKRRTEFVDAVYRAGLEVTRRMAAG